MAAGKISNMKGIARRWLLNSAGVIILLLIALIAILSLVIRGSI